MIFICTVGLPKHIYHFQTSLTNKHTKVFSASFTNMQTTSSQSPVVFSQNTSVLRDNHIAQIKGFKPIGSGYHMVVAAVPSFILPDFISLLIHSLYPLMLWRETCLIPHKVILGYCVP